MMERFTPLHSLVVPLDRANVDTDAIIPKQFMKSIRRTGFGDNLFDEWRYLDRGEPGQDVSKRPLREDFPLNQRRYAGARILLTRENFGCGSSREHAPWALRDHGIRVLIAPSFADIFHGNCFKNGMLPIVMPPERVQAWFEAVERTPGYALSVDLQAQRLRSDDGEETPFTVEPERRHRLLHGLDDIGLTLQHAENIRAHEALRRQAEPWLFPDSKA
jgi:3-isopropylmalate/(R)-2-methylmalate dehydratase small subunit